MDSSDDEEGPRIKRRPGETKQQAIERIKKQKELRRLENFMRFAYPRQRETHIYKKKMLSPEDLNQSVDLLKLKQESMRLDREKSIAENANIIDKNSSVQVASEIFAQ